MMRTVRSLGFLFACTVAFSGCLSDGSVEEGYSTDRLDEVHVDAELWEDHMFGTAHHNISAYITLEEVRYRPGPGPEATLVTLRSDEGGWQAVPVPGRDPMTWVARDGPTWPIGTLVEVTVRISDGVSTQDRVLSDVEVQAAY